MPVLPHQVFALQIEAPDRFVDIFGPTVSSLVWDDIVDGFCGVARKILRRHTILSSVAAPFLGRCFLTFAWNPAPLSFDSEEQVSALTAAGKRLLRTMLQTLLGTSTGSKLNFKFALTPVSKPCMTTDGINASLNEAFSNVPCCTQPFAAMGRDQFVAILGNKAVETFVQPIVCLPGERVIGYEALSRGPLKSPVREADMLFGTAEHLELTDALELLCVEKALAWAERIPASLWMAINVGPSLLKSAAFLDLVCQEQVKPFWPRLVFELTEHLPIDSVAELQDSISHLKAKGISLSLDDTGCGFFDLSTVKQFRPKIVKLCITVIRRLGRNDDVLKDLNLTVARISEFGDHVLGEGVEQRGQLDMLKQTGVSMAQGNYFDEPKPARDVLDA